MGTFTSPSKVKIQQTTKWSLLLCQKSSQEIPESLHMRLKKANPELFWEGTTGNNALRQPAEKFLTLHCKAQAQVTQELELLCSEKNP